MKYFDSKTFNAEVFLAYMKRVPDTRRNELVKSGVLKKVGNLKTALTEQVGGNYVVRPLFGNIGKSTKNYDGQTDITSNTSTTFKQGVIVVGRADAWLEKDFSEEVTGVNFLENVAVQVAKYWEDVDQDILLKILKAIFGISAFAATHVYDVGAAIGATSINSAVQKACGDNKNAFKVAIMHSSIATQLENMQILEYIKYTDPSGITRNTNLATVNGKIVFIDDTMPSSNVAAVYTLTTDVAINTAKTYYTRSGSEGAYVYTVVASPDVDDIATYYERTAEAYVEYTTYILGEGAFDYEDVGVVVPIEMDRDPKINGGQDTLYSRQRKIYAPVGFSFKVANITTDSPTDAELETTANWELITDAAGTTTYPLKAIPICAIKSRVY